MTDQLKIIEIQAAKRIQKVMKSIFLRQRAGAILLFYRKAEIKNAAARKLQLIMKWFVLRCKEERDFLAASNIHAIFIQRIVRGWIGRLRLRRKKNELKLHMDKTQCTIKIQAFFRGYYTRKHDITIKHAIAMIRSDRRHKIHGKAAKCIQRAVRRLLGIKYAASFRSLFVELTRCAIILQSFFRKSQSKRMIEYLRQVIRTRNLIEAHAATTLQKMFYNARIRSTLTRYLRHLQNMKRLRLRMAIRIQSVARGCIYGRFVFARLVRQKRKEDGAATEIQRFFRGSLVISWSHIRMNKVAAFVFLRQGHEIERCIIDSTQRSKDQAEGGPDDDASDLSIENANNDDLDFSNNDASLPFAFERSLIGLYCKVFWTMNQSYYSGRVEKYSKKKRRWKVVYDDGDTEWINFEVEHERVLIHSNGSWKTFKMYQPAVLTDQWKDKSSQLERKAESERGLIVAKSWIDLGWEENEESNGSMISVKRRRYYSLETRDVVFSASLEQFNQWKIVEEDGDDPLSVEWYYEDSFTGERVSSESLDPRFVLDSETNWVKQEKEELLAHLRFCSYVYKGILDDYNESSHKTSGNYVASMGGEMKRQMKTLNRARVLMPRSLAKARTIWNTTNDTTNKLEKEDENMTELITYYSAQQNQISQLFDFFEGQEYKRNEMKAKYYSANKAPN
eukprot:CAMPEP_0194399190 /NCGR_PEP_ID=MMETSP0174-20130528/126521_1 /TAXON_ID=216777 /ORGANISM="Proboscia alata, Strain PI-D3" /LENGTH=676 /DNA_ID=CAMNT_0039195569 /DNA_START=1373 /DNA_END=3403 /DNA_ORIENTATION=+